MPVAFIWCLIVAFHAILTHEGQLSTPARLRDRKHSCRSLQSLSALLICSPLTVFFACPYILQSTSHLEVVSGAVQSGEWGEGDPETDAEAESQRMWREGDLLQLTSHRKQGARQLWGKGMSLKRPSQKTSWWHQARAFVGQKLGVEDGAK